VGTPAASETKHALYITYLLRGFMATALVSWGSAAYRVAQNKIPQQTICNISATSGLILEIFEVA